MNSGEGSTNLPYFDDVGLLLSLGANQLAFLGYIDVILSEGFGRRSTNWL